ncbi:MAG: glycosyltransferase family 2 protein [Blautia sp.]|uniref:glycosyltransferase family 2 protein n=1 Tax=Blautia sp. TaxID=1955243 RepID=UPI0025C37349|nr:glycosyltransferase family 2 protein [Blautia sp.]MCI6304069.1 glycosyltransferase family 2 protein [Blautia sp.]
MSRKQSAGGKIQWTRMLKKLSPYTIQKGFRYLKHYGPKEFWIRLHERFEPEEVPYGPWYQAYVPDQETLEAQKKHKFDYRPLISIAVPAYQTPVEFLKQMIESLISQTYPEWELCIANASPDNEEMQRVLADYSAKDSRVRFCNLKENLGIAENTNRAFSMAKGEFMGLLDHDDLLAPNALYEIVQALQDHPQADALYTDEDKVTTELDEHFQPHLKPDFNLDLLRSNNYICHFFVVRRSIVEKAGGFRKEFDGAQDYDFIFRCTENAREVLHVPEILYHWRTHKASTADNPASKMYAFEAGKRAIEANLERTGTKGVVSHTQDLGFYRVKYPVQGKPLVSVIIPNKDEKETLQTCMEMLNSNTSYQNFEIIIIENNSTTDEIFRYYKELSKDPRIHLLRWGKEFNYSAINNFGVAHAKGEYLLFLNNDIKSINPDWMEELLGVCQRPEVGGVGAKLIYPDNTIQHAGCVVGMGGIAGHMFVDMPADRTGYLHKASLLQDMSAVTAACLMMKKEVFEEAGGFTEELAVAFNDVDLCLKVRKNNHLIVYDPYAKLYHMESKTRGAEDSKEKVRRFQTEIEYMRCHWLDILKNGDPYYNKNLSLTKWNYSLKPIPGMETAEMKTGQNKEKSANTGRKSCRKYQ